MTDVELRPERWSAAEVDAAAAGRDRVVDAARAVSMLFVALGHWLVVDLRRLPGGGLEANDVLAELPGLQFLSWLFQVMPVFFAAGGVVGFASWQRHRTARADGAADAGTTGAWVAARLWRLLWPTLPVVAFWVVVTQFGRHVLGVEPSLLDATRGIALVIWFLAIYAVVTALVPALDAAVRRLGLAVPIGLAVAAAIVDAVAAATGYVSTTTPSWVWVNYLLVWAAVTCLGRWWPASPSASDRRVGVLLALGGAAVLVATTAAGWYPVSMVGVAGQARSNSLPPTIALLALGVAQYGLLVLARPTLARWLQRPRAYVTVMALGSRAMTVYLWHLLAVAVLTLAVVLPGLWPAPAIGSGSWWGLRLAWVLLAAAITTPVVLVAARFERPPGWPLTTSGPRAAGATVAACVGWASLAISGFHPAGLPAGLPLVALAGLGGAVVLLVTPTERA